MMHFQYTSVPIPDVQFIFWAPKFIASLPHLECCGIISTPWVSIDLGVFFPVPGYPHTQVAKSVQHLIDYNWLENNALIHYLFANETGCSFSGSLPAILPKPYTQHLLGNPIVAAGVGWAAHKPGRLVLDPQYTAETRLKWASFSYCDSYFNRCQFGKCAREMAGAEAFKGQVQQNKSEEVEEQRTGW